ncbi:sugar ABC transporter ATP-binding protein [Bradyrhizobium erythrophlei]|uniref:sugar ABC transporter ATP-binding protein n=1 Tax=Bradyrhizobium erythrophlei TaxID=1437360 RepID=UPI0035ECD447
MNNCGCSSRASSVRLAAENVSKTYGGIPVLESVSLEIRRSEVLGIAGENGAGKSTMMRMLCGIAPPNTGTLKLDGSLYNPSNYAEAVRAGISMVFQEQALIPNILVYENMFLGHEKAFRNRAGMVDREAAVYAARDALRELELNHISPRAVVADLPFEDRQMVEIARAFALANLYGVREPIVLLDEPTAAIPEEEVETLFRRVESLTDRCSFVLITHRLSEYFRLCDRLYVFKDGRNVSEVGRDEMSETRLHELMVGRVRSLHYYKEDRQGVALQQMETALEVRGLCGRTIKDVSFVVRKGEVLGIGGLLGCGKDEIGDAISGAALPSKSGEVEVDGRPLPIRRRTEAAIAAGIGYVPRERKTEGLIPYLPLKWNASLAYLPHIKYWGLPWIDSALENELVSAQMRRLRIKAADVMQICAHLSGGNQQKVVLAKWLMCRPNVLVLQNPTRGIDVGAKEEIYSLIRDLTESGVGILLISDDLPELIGLSDRILLMKEGSIVDQCSAPPGAKPPEDQLIRHMV